MHDWLKRVMVRCDHKHALSAEHDEHIHSICWYLLVSIGLTLKTLALRFKLQDLFMAFVKSCQEDILTIEWVFGKYKLNDWLTWLTDWMQNFSYIKSFDRPLVNHHGIQVSKNSRLLRCYSVHPSHEPHIACSLVIPFFHSAPKVAFNLESRPGQSNYTGQRRDCLQALVTTIVLKDTNLASPLISALSPHTIPNGLVSKP
jgi:hypothetical protein